MARNDPVMVTNMQPPNSYDGFNMRSANINKPDYDSNRQAPNYNAPEVARPKSVINGRRMKNNYDHMKSPTHPDFYPIYGPQGEKRVYDRERRPKENVVKEPKEKREEPRKYYSEEPNTKEKYKSEPKQRKERNVSPRDNPDRQIKETPVRRNEKRQPEIVDPYRSKIKRKAVEPEHEDEKKVRQEREPLRYNNDREEPVVQKDREKPINNNKRLDPVIVEPYQSKLRKRVDEPKEREEHSKPQPKQRVEETKRDESLIYKEPEKPQKRSDKFEPVVIQPYQSKLRKKVDEPDRNKENEEPKQKPKVEETYHREPVNEIHKEHEKPKSKSDRKEPVIVELYQSKLRKKVDEPEKHKENEAPKPKVEEIIQREPVTEIHKEQEKPKSKNNRTEPVIVELYQSKLRKKVDEPEKHKENEAPKPKVEETFQREPVTEIHKEQEKPKSKNNRTEPVIVELYQSKLRKKVDEPEKHKENEAPKPKVEETYHREPVNEIHKEHEKPKSKSDRKEPVIVELYQSKLKEKKVKPKPKEKKKEPKVEEVKQEKENIPKEENNGAYLNHKDKETPTRKPIKDPIIIDLYRSKLKEKTQNIKEEKQKKPDLKKEEIIVSKEEPKEELKKEEKKPDPYAIIYEPEKEKQPKEEPKKTDKYTQEPKEEFKKQEETKLAPNKEHERPELQENKEKTNPKVKEPVKKPEEMENDRKVTPQRVKMRGRNTSSVRARYYEQADEGLRMEVMVRIAQTTSSLSILTAIWKSTNITLTAKIRLMRTLVLSLFP